MIRFYILLMVLVAPSFSVLPFYCRIRKIDCSLPKNARCCPDKPAVIETGTDMEGLINENINNNATTGEPKKENQDMTNKTNNNTDNTEHDVLEVAPSQRDEVVVKLTGEIVKPAINGIPKTKTKPEPKVPRFCQVLRFSCDAKGTRAKHPCCRFKEHSDDNSTKKSVQPLPKINKTPETTNPVKYLKTNKISVVPTQQIIEKKTEQHIKDNRDSDTKLHKISRPFNKRKSSTSNKAKKQKVAIRKRRPTFGYTNKLGVCRIINCKRAPSHKCCKKPLDTTTEHSEIPSEVVNEENKIDSSTESLRPITERSRTTAGEVNNKNKTNIINNQTSITTEKVYEENRTEISSKRSGTITERSKTTAGEVNHMSKTNIINEKSRTTTERSRIPAGDISSKNKTDITTVSSKSTTTETVYKEDRTDVTTEIFRTSTTKTKTNIEEVLLKEEPNTTIADIVNKSVESINILVEENIAFYSNMSSAALKTPNFETTDETHKKMPADNLQNEQEYFPARTTEKLNNYNADLFSSPKSPTIEELASGEFPTKSIQEVMYASEDQRDDVSGSRRAKLLEYPSYISVNEIQEVLDLNQITPRVAGKCFRFDCVSQPSHQCCQPIKTNQKRHLGGKTNQKRHLGGKTNQKRHLGGNQENNGDRWKANKIVSNVLNKLTGQRQGYNRVTATITRIEKTVNNS